MSNAREEIFSRLNRLPQPELSPRPPRIPGVDLPDDVDGRIATFTTELETKTGVVLRAANTDAVGGLLADIAAAENIRSVMISNDDVVSSLDMVEWGRQHQVSVLEVGAYQKKKAFREAAFEEADAGITGADYAFAESATLAIRHNSAGGRLVSLAPPIHIAIFPVDRLYKFYEEVIPELFENRDQIPSQLTFITGPSATADIAATPTVGMHGPKKLFVIIIG